MLRAATGLLAIAAGAGIAGCQPQAAPAAFHGSDISGSEVGKGWALPDVDGTPRSAKDYTGKVAVVFFGFIHCPDVCPTTLAQLTQVKQNLGKDGERLQVLFVTVDPERDTPEIMRDYLSRFDPSFVGLRGSPDQLAAAAKTFKAFYAKVPGEADGAYTMDHSSGMYAFDPEGNVRLYLRHGQSIEDITADIRRLLG